MYMEFILSKTGIFKQSVIRQKIVNHIYYTFLTVLDNTDITLKYCNIVKHIIIQCLTHFNRQRIQFRV